MVRELSVAISDTILALASYHAGLTILPKSFSAAIGFISMGIAASFGVRRFISADPDPSLIQRHQYISWVVRVLGVPLIASAYCKYYNLGVIGNIVIACGLGFVMVDNLQTLSSSFKGPMTEVIGSSAVVGILAIGLYNGNGRAVVGAAIYALAGLVIQTEGYIGPIRRVDLFHYALVLGNLAFLEGLIQQQPPIFYKKQ